MTDLTEKWEAGELEDCFYYTKTGKEQIIAIDMYDKESDTWLLNSDKDMPPFEVLAHVPIYYEFDALKMNCEFTHTCLKGSRLENARLKELLKECQTIISNNLYEFDSDDCSRSCDLIKEIEEALK